MSTTQTVSQSQTNSDEHPGDLAHKVVKGEIELSEVPIDDYDYRDVNRFRTELKTCIDHAGTLPAEKVERAGEALQEVPDPAEE